MLREASAPEGILSAIQAYIPSSLGEKSCSKPLEKTPDVLYEQII